jgi:hypothetical protein
MNTALRDALQLKKEQGRSWQGRGAGSPVKTSSRGTPRKARTAQPKEDWFIKSPTIAGEANTPGSTIDRLGNPASFTGK